MTRKEYVEYLNMFSEDSEIGFIVANPSDGVREHYPVKDFICITDTDHPVVCIQVDVGEDIEGLVIE